MAATADALKAEGNVAFERGDFAQAVALYTRALDVEGADRAVLLSNRSAAWLHTGDASRALVDAEACVQLRPEWPKAHSRVGAAMCALHRFDEATAAYKRGIQLDPAASGPLREALRQVQRARDTSILSTASTSADAPSTDATAAEESTEVVTGATLSTVPPAVRAEALKTQGNAAFERGDWALALTHYSEAIAIDGSNHVLYSNRAAALIEIGTRESLQRALADAVRCLTLRPDFGKGYLRKGRALLSLGRADDALEAFRAGSRVDVLNAKLREGMAEAASAQARGPEYAQYCEEVMVAAATREAEARRAAAASAADDGKHHESDGAAAADDDDDGGDDDLAALERAIERAKQAAAAKPSRKRPRESSAPTDAGETVTTDLEGGSRSARRSRAEGAGSVGGPLGSHSDDVDGGDGDEKHDDNGGGDADGDGEAAGATSREVPAAGGTEGASDVVDAEAVLEAVRWRPTERDIAAAAAAAAAWQPGAGAEQVSRLTGRHHQWRNLNPFGVLQLHEAATADLVTARYRKLSALVHPDKHSNSSDATRAFEAVKAAYEALGDPLRREMAVQLVRQGRRMARAAFRKASQSGGAAPVLADLEESEITKAFASAELRRRKLDDARKQEAAEAWAEAEEEKRVAREEAAQDQGWETARNGRVDNWRRFQETGKLRGAGLHRDLAQKYGGKAAVTQSNTGYRATWR